MSFKQYSSGGDGGEKKRGEKKRAEKRERKKEKGEKKKRRREIIEPSFENNALQSGQLEYMSIVQMLVDEELREKLWIRFENDHFSTEAPAAIFKRVNALLKAGKDVPSLSVLATDKALPDSARTLLESTLARVDRGLPLTRGEVKIGNKKIPTQSSVDFETHVFDTLDALRFMRKGIEHFTHAIEDATTRGNTDPLDCPRLFEEAAQKVLEIRAAEALSDVTINVGYGTDKNDKKKIKSLIEKIFSPDKPRFKTGFKQYDDDSGGFQAGEVICVGSSPGGGKCVVGETLILTGEGVLEAEEVVGNSFVGYKPSSILVSGEEGPENTSHFYREENVHTIRLETDLGFWNEGTDKHRVRVVGSDGAVVWKRHDEVRVGDYVVIEYGQRMWGTRNLLDADTLRYLGVLAAEGGLSEVPVEVRASSESSVVEFLRALSGSDDYENAEYRVKHKRVADQLRVMLCNLGVVTRTEKDGERYTLTPISVDEVPNLLPRPAVLSRVCSVRKSRKRKTVYDLTVPGTHTFAANGMIQHNTAFMLSTMLNMFHMGISTAMLQLELAEDQVNERLVANIADIDGELIRTGKINEHPKLKKKVEEAWRELDEMGKANKARMQVYAPSECSVHGCEMVFKRFPYRVWFIDYINLMVDDLDWKQLANVVRQFKQLAKKYGIAIVLAVQVNVDAETGEIDVRYSKAIKEHADIFFAWNLTKEDKENGVVWARHIKARQYNMFDFPMGVDLKHARFTSYQGSGIASTERTGEFATAKKSSWKNRNKDVGEKFGDSAKRKPGGKRPQDDLAESMVSEDKAPAVRVTIEELVKRRNAKPKIHVPRDLEDDDEQVEKKRKKRKAS